MPVLDAAGGLLGTFAVYDRLPRKPSAQEIDLTQLAASLAAFVIQRHRDAQKLRDNEARLRAAIGGARIGVWDCDASGEGAWFDDWCEHVGIDPCNRRERETTWRAQIHPDDLNRYTTSCLQCELGTAESYVVEYRVRTRQGEWCWLCERGSVTARDQSGMPSHYVGVCFDISDQMRLEKALGTAEDRFELAINAAQLPMWEYDVVNDVVSGNIYWHRTVGYNLTEEAASKRSETWMSDVHPDDAARHDQIFAGSAADETGFYENEFRIKVQDGEYKWLLDRARVVARSAAGAPLRVVGVSLDIDTRKRMEDALRKSEQSLATALWGAQSAYWTTDLVANTTQMSKSFFTMTSINPKAWEREVEPWCAMVHPDDAPMGCARYRAHLEGRTDAYEHEYRLRTPGGWRWIQDRGRVVDRDASGRPLRIAGTSMDVSARKSIERKIVEAVNREQRRISYDLHDGIGQRLTGIALLLDAVTAEIRKQLPSAIDDLETIAVQVRETIKETQGLVRGVLPASIQRGDITDALRTLAAEVSLSYHMNVVYVADGWISQQLPAESAHHIFRSAQEALNNAKRHGQATLTTVTLQSQDGLLDLLIEDNGTGIQGSIQEDRGSGLKIMDYRAQILGGTISVEPGAIGGARIILRCPLGRDANPLVPFTQNSASCACIASGRRSRSIT